MTQLGFMLILAAAIGAIWAYSRLQVRYWSTLESTERLARLGSPIAEVVHPVPAHAPEESPQEKAVLDEREAAPA